MDEQNAPAQEVQPTKQKVKYPQFAVRMTHEEIEYLRAEAKNKGMKTSKYVKGLLFPFGSPTTK